MADTMQQVAFTAEQSAKLLELLGLPADTTDADLILATVEDLARQAGGAAPAKRSEVAAAAKRAGLEVVDADTLSTLRRDAAEGRQVKAAAEQQRIETIVSDAIKAGKIAPARQKHWISLIQADPGTADVLASVPDNTVPVKEICHGVGREDIPDAAEAGEWFR